MILFNFELKFTFPDTLEDPTIYVESLGAAGCDDAIIGIGQKGRIALQFTREAKNAFEAVLSAIKDVKNVIPKANLIEATPDLVGLTDIAEFIGVSRQNVRKLMLTHNHSFPVPVHAGKSSLWHLSNILEWFEVQQNKKLEPGIVEIAAANMQVNIAKESAKSDPEFQKQLASLSL